MYEDTLITIGENARTKADYLRSHWLAYLVSAMLAGAYVGVGIILSFAIGGPLAAAHSSMQKIAMATSFAVALSLVIFAGAELFTGCNLVMAVGRWCDRISYADLLKVWGLSWIGNFFGAGLLALLLFWSGVLNTPSEFALVQQVAVKKMHLPVVELVTRGALCNWLVCLAVWCTFRMRSESGKLIMIFWCLYAFIAAGFEHSVANMTLLTLALFQPHATSISVIGLGHNLFWVTFGNIIGGTLFVAGAYCAARGRDVLATRNNSITLTSLSLERRAR